MRWVAWSRLGESVPRAMNGHFHDVVIIGLREYPSKMSVR